MEVKLTNVTKKFGDFTAVDHVDLTIADGQLTGLLGPSGCGKSTLLYMISGLSNVTEGQIMFGGRDVTALAPDKRNIGLVFQNYALYPHMTVFENIAFPLGSKRGEEKMSRAQIKSVVHEVASLVQIGDLLRRKPKELSGGQQQRVAIARALVKRPDVLLLDEPLSNLDARLRMEMRKEIRRIQTETKVTTIFVTHDQEEAMSITDSIVLMKSGVVQQADGAHEMYMNPVNDFVASFMGNPPISFIRVSIRDGIASFPDGQAYSFSGISDGSYRLGIRPEAWVPGNALQAKLLDVEMRGQDQIVKFALGDTIVSAVLDAEFRAFPGMDLRFDLRPARCYFFDAKTGARV